MPRNTSSSSQNNSSPIRGIEADFGPEHADTFRCDLHPDLRTDYVLANPPFNDSDWFRKDDDARWQYGVPPRGNANFAWVQHFIHPRATRHGRLRPRPLVVFGKIDSRARDQEFR